MILVSACLLGARCRYDGLSSGMHPKIMKLVDDGEYFLPVCPEQLGGLATPREPADFIDPSRTGSAALKGEGFLKTKSDKDVTSQFVRGALEAADLAKIFQIKKAILRRRSPSCGFGETYSRGKVIDGDGVLAAKLFEMGVEIETLGKHDED